MRKCPQKKEAKKKKGSVYAHHLVKCELPNLPALPDLGLFVAESQMRDMLVYQRDVMHLANLLWQWEFRFKCYTPCSIQAIIVSKSLFMQAYGNEELKRLVDYIIVQASGGYMDEKTFQALEAQFIASHPQKYQEVHPPAPIQTQTLSPSQTPQYISPLP